jgi:hypothetical protein
MKNVFLKAAIITAAVFIIGIYVGFVLDSMRVEDVKERITEIDNLWNDVRLMQSYIQKFSNRTDYCGFLLQENLKVGDKIYDEGLKVEEYENTNRFASDLIIEKTRYALLDLQFWINSIDLKEQCNGNYSTVIYFYSQYNRTPEQNFQDRVLWDLKQKCGSKIIYITFPADIGITTIEVIKNIYGIESVPSILINEETLLNSPVTLREIEDYVSC